MDTQVESIAQVDLSGLKCPVIIVFQDDTRHIARVYEADQPTDVVIIKESFTDLQRDIAVNTQMTFIWRDPGDDRRVIGTWI